MATLNSVISKVSAVKPDKYTPEQMAGWVSELDGKISVETLRLTEPITYDFPADGDNALLVPAPYDNLYDLYLFAMMDFHNDEMDRYTNSYIMFNKAFSDWKKYYLRTNIPPATAVFSNVV